MAIGATLWIAACGQPAYPISDAFDERIKAGCTKVSECMAIVADARERQSRYCAIADKGEAFRTRCEQATAEARAADGLRPAVPPASAPHVEPSTPQATAQPDIVRAPEESHDSAAVAAAADAARREEAAHREEDERRQQAQNEIVSRVLAEQRRAPSPKPGASSTDRKVAMIRAECQRGSCRPEKLDEIVRSAETASEKAALVGAARAAEDAYCARVDCFRR